MVEIALCLAIIGLALVAIIGVLPMGLNVQKDNREETLVNQDATVFMNAIRGGERGLNDLTNYVFAITNSWTLFNANGSVNNFGVNGYTPATISVAAGYPFQGPGAPINTGARIIGLLSTPEYMDNNGVPIPNLIYGGYSNYVVAYVHSISGPAVEKPPQNNDVIRNDSFGYKIICVNAPEAVDTNIFNLPADSPAYLYAQQLTANLHELRLMFLWPLLPNGGAGYGRHTFATTVAGQMDQVNDNGQWLYFFQPQSFTNAP